MPRQLLRVASLFGFALSALVSLGASPASATEDEVIASGKQEFGQNCAPCHGASAKGDGEWTDILITKPADLTAIAKRNGGKFPFWDVYKAIDGEKPLKSHLISPMPIWSAQFKAQEEKEGKPPAYVRILTITHYLESIQER